MNKNMIDKQENRPLDFTDQQIQLVKHEFSRAKSYASEYQDNTPIAHFLNTRLKRVSELLSEFKSGRVLDIGCGPAIIGNTFRERPIEYYGVDISEDMIRECIYAFRADPQFHFVLGKNEELPFIDSYFDVVLCLGVFEYVMEGNIAMHEIGRVLKPNGLFIATMLNENSPYRVWQSYGYWKFQNEINKLFRLIKRIGSGQERRISNRGERKRPKSKIYSETTFRHLIASNGIKVEDILYYDFNLFFAPMDNLFPRLSIFLSKKLESLCRSKLKFLGTGFMLKCRKY